MSTFNLNLIPEHIDAILGALAELPFKISAPVVQEIHSQLQPQVQAQQVPVVSDGAPGYPIPEGPALDVPVNG